VEQAQACKGTINIPDIVTTLRSCRNTMVQSIDQYMFIWQAAIDALTQLQEFEQVKVQLYSNKQL
jgi:protein tyrosine phosphatase